VISSSASPRQIHLSNICRHLPTSRLHALLGGFFDCPNLFEQAAQLRPPRLCGVNCSLDFIHLLQNFGCFHVFLSGFRPTLY